MWGTDEGNAAAFGGGPMMKMTKSELRQMEAQQAAIYGRQLEPEPQMGGGGGGSGGELDELAAQIAADQAAMGGRGGFGGGGGFGDGGFGGGGFGGGGGGFGGGGGGGGGVAMPSHDLAGDQISAFIVRYFASFALFPTPAAAAHQPHCPERHRA